MVARARRTPAVARRLRRAPEGDRVLGAALARAHHRLADPRRGGTARDQAHGRPAAARQRQAAGPRQRVGPRHAVVAGQDGPQPAPAAGEAHALLARPLRHARPGRSADAGSEPQAARARAGPLPRAPARGDHRPGDAGLPLAGGLRQARPERELRARADGALHPRRHRRLHRARRARGGPRADRLQGQLPRRAPADHLLRPRAPRRRGQAAARPPRQARLAGRPAPRRRPSLARALPRGQAVGLLHHRAAAGGDPQAPGPRLRALAPPHRAGRARDPRQPRPLRRPRPPADGQVADRPAGRQPAHGRARGRHRRLGVDQLDDGADALQPAERRRVGLGRGVDVDGHDARALPVRDVDLQGPPGEGDQGLGRPDVVGGRAGRARPRRDRAPVDEQRPPTASSRAWPSAS